MSQPLFDPDAERAVLAAILLENECLARVGELGPGDFYQPAHALVFDVMLALRAQGVPFDAITLVEELRRRERLNTVGGQQFVHALTDSLPTLAYVENHARIVREHADHRRAFEAVRRAGERMAAGEPRSLVWQDLVRSMGDEVRAPGAARVGQDLEELHSTALARARGEDKPLATPWESINARLGGGLWPGMYVLVGSTGSGKSQWAVQAAVRAAMHQVPVLYLALELSRRDLAARVMGIVGGVPWSALLRGALGEQRIQDAFASAAQRVNALPFYTECGVPFGYGVETLQSRARSLHPKMIVLDYLQLCGSRSGEDPRIAVGRVSYAARAIARDMGAVVLVLSSTARANYAEMVSDPNRDPSEMVGLGKESGEIEYAADGVMVLARDAQANDPQRRVLVMAKNRYGELGRANLAWNGTLFADEGGEGMDATRARKPDPAKGGTEPDGVMF